MRNLTCIVCPIGCSLEVEDNNETPEESLSVTGNRCPRGAVYAIEEVRAPKRVVTATCKTSANHIRVPVKTTSPCPREKIPALLQDIYKTKVTLPVKTGDIIINNWNGENINVAAARNINC
jgi:CxxC motif-containing protein